MENPTEFNLNAAIREWRQRLGQSPALRHDSLEELESHLRDSVSGLQVKGLSEEEGFLIASRRMGNASALGAEYAKVHRKDLWLERLFWMAAGVLSWTLVSLLSRVVADSAVFGSLFALGYEFRSPMDTLLAGRWLVAMFLAAAHALVMLVLVGAGWWLMTNTRIPTAIARRLRHPLALGLAVIPCLLLLAANALVFFRTLLFAKWFSVQQIGAISVSISISSILVSVFTTILLSVALVWLARRRMQLRGSV